jgi:DNA-binding protein HU-beta
MSMPSPARLFLAPSFQVAFDSRMRLARSQDGVLDAITEALKQGDRVNASGFGTFAVSMRDARTGRNPKTGESIEISASRSAKFKPGKQMKESLNAAPAASEPD